MPKIKSTTFEHRNETGEKFEFKSDISVDSDGLFSVTVPKEIAETIKNLPGKRDFWITRPREKYRVTGRELNRIQEVVDDAIVEYMAVETTIERVIVYSSKVELSAWENSDGTLHPNGYIGESREEGGRWHPMGDRINASNRTDHFQVGLYAEVLDMVTHRRPNSERVEFRLPDWEHANLEYPGWGSKLNGFTSLKRPNEPENCSRLPYTEENAQFFYQMLMAMCYLGRNMHNFFGDKNNVAKAIERGTLPMLVDQAAPSGIANG